MMGGRLVDPQTTDLAERRLLERGRRNVAGLRRAGAAGLRDGQRAVDQRLRRRLSAQRRRGDRLAGLPAIPHARGVARRAGPRVQPRAQRRHAAEPPPDRHGLRHPGPFDHRLLRDAFGRLGRFVVARFRRPPRRQSRRHLLHRPGALHPGLPGRAAGQYHQGRHLPAAGVPGRRLQRAVHPQPQRPGRRLEEDRRAGRRLADQRSPRPRDQPHVLRRRLCRIDLQPLRHPSAAGGADPPARSEFRRQLRGGRGR